MVLNDGAWVWPDCNGTNYTVIDNLELVGATGTGSAGAAGVEVLPPQPVRASPRIPAMARPCRYLLIRASMAYFNSRVPTFRSTS